MKLYKVIVEHTFFMVSADGDEADFEADGCAREAVREDMTLDSVNWSEVTALSDIPSAWRNCCPYGVGGNVRTVAQWFALGKEGGRG